MRGTKIFFFLFFYFWKFFNISFSVEFDGVETENLLNKAWIFEIFSFIFALFECWWGFWEMLWISWGDWITNFPVANFGSQFKKPKFLSLFWRLRKTQDKNRVIEYQLSNIWRNFTGVSKSIFLFYLFEWYSIISKFLVSCLT